MQRGTPDPAMPRLLGPTPPIKFGPIQLTKLVSPAQRVFDKP
jgi:hypothetical protein